MTPCTKVYKLISDAIEDFILLNEYNMLFYYEL